MKFVVLLIFILVYIVFFGVIFLLLFDTKSSHKAKTKHKFKTMNDAMVYTVGTDWKTYISDDLYSHLNGATVLDKDIVEFYFLVINDDYIHEERSKSNIQKWYPIMEKIKNKRKNNGQSI